MSIREILKARAILCIATGAQSTGREAVLSLRSVRSLPPLPCGFIAQRNLPGFGRRERICGFVGIGGRPEGS